MPVLNFQFQRWAEKDKLRFLSGDTVSGDVLEVILIPIKLEQTLLLPDRCYYQAYTLGKGFAPPAPTQMQTGEVKPIIAKHQRKATNMALEKVVYTAHATATGGRDGMAKTDDGKLEVKLQLPKEMGGTGEGTNPEQLFAAGYAACFIGALKGFAGSQKLRLDPGTFINSSVSFGPLAHGANGFGIAVALEIHIPGVDHEKAVELVNGAHEICPYSNATRGNIDVTLTVA